MTKKTFKNLCLNYNKPLDKDLYEMWDYNLRCYDDEEIDKAINLIMGSDKYMPTLNRVLEVIKSTIKYVPKHIDKWDNIEIVNEPIDEEAQAIYDDFNSYIKSLQE